MIKTSLPSFSVTKGPKLGNSIKANLPKSWFITAWTEKDPSVKRMIGINGPKKRLQIFGRPTFAFIHVSPDKVEIERWNCSQANFDKIVTAVKASTDLPVVIMPKE